MNVQHRASLLVLFCLAYLLGRWAPGLVLLSESIDLTGIGSGLGGVAGIGIGIGILNCALHMYLDKYLDG